MKANTVEDLSDRCCSGCGLMVAQESDGLVLTAHCVRLLRGTHRLICSLRRTNYVIITIIVYLTPFWRRKGLPPGVW